MNDGIMSTSTNQERPFRAIDDQARLRPEPTQPAPAPDWIPWGMQIEFGNVGVRVNVGCKMYFIEDRARAAVLISMYLSDTDRLALVTFVQRHERLPWPEEIILLKKGLIPEKQEGGNG